MEGINYVNLIEISSVVIEIQGVENGDLVVPANNTLVCLMSFLAAGTRLCVLILSWLLIIINSIADGLHRVTKLGTYTIYNLARYCTIV